MKCFYTEQNKKPTQGFLNSIPDEPNVCIKKKKKMRWIMATLE